MAYDAEFIDGFDKYGPVGGAYITGGALPTLLSLLLSGEWTTFLAFGDSPQLSLNVVAPLSGPAGGKALHIYNIAPGFGGEMYLSKTLANYQRIIAGFAVNFGAPGAGFCIANNGVVQVSVFGLSTGQIQVNRGSIAGGTSLGVTTQSLPVGSTFEIEVDITVAPGTGGSVSVWLNGALSSIALTSVNTSADGNSVFNQSGIGANNHGDGTFDHLYEHYFTSGGSGDTPLLYGPIIVTQFPISDATVAFVPEQGVIGEPYVLAGNNSIPTGTPGANKLFLRQFTPPSNMTLNSVTCLPAVSNSVAQFEAAVYSDNAGAPDVLLSGGTLLTGCTANHPLVGTITTPQVLIGGTPYWIGFDTDTAIALNLNGDVVLLSSSIANNTFSGGLPNPAPVMTYNQLDWAIWGQCTGGPSNYVNVNENPAGVPVVFGQGGGNAAAYNQSSTVDAEDLFNFPALPSGVSAISTVAVKVLAAIPDGGARSITVQTKSGGTDISGPTAALSGSFLTVPGYYDTDPNTAGPWAPSGVNAATSGYKIAS